MMDTGFAAAPPAAMAAAQKKTAATPSVASDSKKPVGQVETSDAATASLAQSTAANTGASAAAAGPSKGVSSTVIAGMFTADAAEDAETAAAKPESGAPSAATPDNAALREQFMATLQKTEAA